MPNGHPPPPMVLKEILVRRLAYLDDFLCNELESYFQSDSSDEAKRECKDLLKRYILAVERLLPVTPRTDLYPEVRLVVMDVPVWTVDESTGETECFVVVGPDEVDPAQGRISCLSPLGAALLLKGVQEVVCLEAPGGRYLYRVEAIGTREPVGSPRLVPPATN